MNTFYLIKSGELKKKDNSLVLITKDEEIYVPIEQVDTICAFGEVTVNKRLLEFLNKRSIELILFNYYGNLVGRFLPVRMERGKCLLEHANAALNAETNIKIARAIQIAAYLNMMNVLKLYQQKGRNVEQIISDLEPYKQELENTHTTEELLLVEARMKKDYYSLFDAAIQNPQFPFERRSRQPPENELNAMISFGNTLLYGTILALIDESRLHSDISFIHSDLRRGPSLHYDLADIYKPVLVDRMIIRLINKKQIDAQTCFSKEENRCYLNEKGKRVFIEEYDRILNTVIEYRNRRMSYRSVIRRDINSLADSLENGEVKFKPFIMKW